MTDIFEKGAKHKEKSEKYGTKERKRLDIEDKTMETLPISGNSVQKVYTNYEI